MKTGPAPAVSTAGEIWIQEDLEMRKWMIAALGACLAVSVFAAGPAAAGKKKKKVVRDSFSARLAPWPKLVAWGEPVGLTKPGCSSGQEDIHWTGVEFKAPFTGEMTLSSSGFTGDWDLYVFDGDLPLARSENNQIDGMAPPEEEIFLELKKGKTVLLVMCNWLGAPDNTADYEFVSR